jgi:hypothetical protein
VEIRAAHRHDHKTGANESRASSIEIVVSEEDVDITLIRAEPLPWPEQGPAEPRVTEILKQPSQQSGNLRGKYALRFLAHLSPD